MNENICFLFEKNTHTNKKISTGKFISTNLRFFAFWPNRSHETILQGEPYRDLCFVSLGGRVRGHQPKTWCPLHKLFYVPLSITQYVLLGFSGSSCSITASNKKNTSKNLAVYLSNYTRFVHLQFHYYARRGCL